MRRKTVILEQGISAAVEDARCSCLSCCPCFLRKGPQAAQQTILAAAGCCSVARLCCAWEGSCCACARLVPNPHGSAPRRLVLEAQDLVLLVNSRLPQGVEPLRVGKMPRWQLGVEQLAGKQDELWRYYSELYRNSTTGAQGRVFPDLRRAARTVVGDAVFGLGSQRLGGPHPVPLPRAS